MHKAAHTTNCQENLRRTATEHAGQLLLGLNLPVHASCFQQSSVRQQYAVQHTSNAIATLHNTTPQHCQPE